MPTALDMLNSHPKYRFDPLSDNPNNLPNQTGIYFICDRGVALIKTIMMDAVFPTIDDFPIIYIGR